MADATPVITPTYNGGALANFSAGNTAPGPMVQNGDVLILRATTTDSTGSLQLRGRLLRFDGEMVDFSETMTFSGTGTQTAVVTNLAGGWIVGFDVARVSGTLTDGEVVASVHVGRNVGSLLQPIMCLASGEVTDIRSLGLGAFKTISAASSSSVLVPSSVAVSNPAAGSDWSTAVPAATKWTMLAYRCKFQCSAAAANRVPTIRIANGATVLSRILVDQVTIANEINLIVGVPNGTWRFESDGTSLWYELPLAPTELATGWTIGSVTTNIQAADQWSEIVLTVIAESV